MKTIKQIAGDIGVSKQAVYKRFKGKLYTEVIPYAHIKDGVTYIEEQGENIIKEDFSKEIITPVGADTEYKQDTSKGVCGADTEQSTDILAILKSTIEILQTQLEVKDKQISDLTELNKELLETNGDLSKSILGKTLIDGSKQQFIEVSNPNINEQTEQKKSIFSNFFRKK